MTKKNSILTGDPTLKWVTIIGGIFQLAFLIAAVVFYRERILYADTAHFAAEITGGGRLYIGHRFIALFSRILPFTAVHIGAPVAYSLALYSINLALIYVLPFLLLTWKFRNRTLAIALLIFQFVFLYRTHYLAISELQHGLVFLSVLWGWMAHLTRQGKLPSRNIWTYLLLFLIMNAHPMMIIAFLASTVLLRDQLTYWNQPDRQLLRPVALLFWLISSVLFYTQYEAVVLSDAIHASIDQLDIYHLRLMLHTALYDYYPSVIAGGLSLGLIMLGMRFRQQLWLLFALGVTAILVYLRFAHQTFTLTFFEVYSSIIPFLLFLGLSIELERVRAPLRNFLLSAMLLLGIVQSFRTVNHAGFYSDRLAVYELVFDAMKTAECTNAILPFYRAPMYDIVDFYATPFESYLLSQIDRRTDNDGWRFTYLPGDSIPLSDFGGYEQYFIGLGMDTINYFPYDRYRKFELIPASYCSPTVHY